MNDIVNMKGEIVYEEFMIGDEVEYNSIATIPRTFVITSVKDGKIAGVGPDGIAFIDKDISRWHKTGRFYPEAVALMTAMKNNKKEGT